MPHALGATPGAAKVAHRPWTVRVESKVSKIWRSSPEFLVEATDKMRRVLAMAAGASALLSADAFMTAPAGAGLRPTIRVAVRPVSSLGDA